MNHSSACELCGERFVRKHTEQRFCSKRCAAIAQRRNDPSTLERLMARTSFGTDAGCWLWMGVRTSDGYGKIRDRGSEVQTHRWMYQLIHGPIPSGREINHLCRVRTCLNPDHLESIVPAETTRRGNGYAAIANRTGQCKRGHPFTPENTYWDMRKGTRNPTRGCRVCRREWFRRRSERKAAA